MLLIMVLDQNVSPNADDLRTYKKRPGTSNSGKEFEYMMCTLYGIKLALDANVSEFEMTTNEQIYGDFDDIFLKVTFKNQSTNTFLLQLKHKESKKLIEKKQLAAAKDDFSLMKYLKSFSTLPVDEDVYCILYTNSTMKKCNKFTISTEASGYENPIETFVKSAAVNDEVKLVENRNPDKSNQNNESNIFRFEMQHDDPKVEKFCKQFYFFTDQENIVQVKSNVKSLLCSTFIGSIYASFVTFMGEWWLGTFVLTKRDILLKLAELSLSPWLKTISRGKLNKKSKLLNQAIMNADLTIVNDASNLLAEIWKGTSKGHFRFSQTTRKYFFTQVATAEEASKVLWYLNEVPLIVKTDLENVDVVNKVLQCLWKQELKTKIVLLGYTTSVEFPGWQVFENLYDVSSQSPYIFEKIIKTFNVSLQKRQKISLVELANDDLEFYKAITVKELMEMSQQSFLVLGNNTKTLPPSYIPRTLGTLTVSIKKIMDSLIDMQKFVLIFSCVNVTRIFKNCGIPILKVSEFLNLDHGDFQKLILLAVNEECNWQNFSLICDKVCNNNVSLIQMLDEDSGALLFQKGSSLLRLETKSRQFLIHEQNIFKCIDNNLKIFFAPPGMGKTTFLTATSKRCPSNFWCIHVKLIDTNAFLKQRPDTSKFLSYLTEMCKLEETVCSHEVKRNLVRRKRVYIFLDGLDEVNSDYQDIILRFASEMSVDYNIWITARDSLRSKISRELKIVGIDVLELTEEKQEMYIAKRLKHAKTDLEKQQIFQFISTNYDVINNKQLLGVPLILYMITENLLTYDVLEHTMFVLTKMFRLFFEGKKTFLFRKLDLDQKEIQLGFSFKHHLTQYEIPALRSCLGVETFEKLNIDYDDEFLDVVAKEGDKMGIIAYVNGKHAIFGHQTFAEYFASVWLTNHLNKVYLIRNEMFSSYLQNLRLIFDTMLAEDNPLHLAIIYKNITQFKSHIDNFSDKDKCNRTALHLACTYGTQHPPYRDIFEALETDSFVYKEMIELLLQQSFNLHEKDKLFNFNCVEYSLFAMCLYPIEKMLEKNLLIESDITKICEYYDSKTLALYAVQFAYQHLLLEALKIDPECLHSFVYRTNPIIAAMYGIQKFQTPAQDIENILDILIQNNAISLNARIITNSYVFLTPLDHASKNGCYQIVKKLLEHGANCSHSNTPLHVMIDFGTLSDHLIEEIKDFVDVNAQNDEGLTALHLACIRDLKQIVDGLIKNGADVNFKNNNGNTALHLAALYSSDALKILLSTEQLHDVNVQNKSGTTPLHYACENGDLDKIEILISNQANLCILDNNGQSCLHYAAKCKKDNSEIIARLLRTKFEINSRDNQNRTPLHLASRYGHVKNVQILLENGADVNAVDSVLENSLFYGNRSQERKLEKIHLLLSVGINCNESNHVGVSLLHLACTESDKDLIKVLLDNGADVNLKDNNNKTALEYVPETWKKREIMKLLNNS